MLFNSSEFLFFLPIVYVFYWFIFSKKLISQNFLLLAASYFFYGWWSLEFLGLLAISTILDYLYGFWVDSENRKKAKLFLYLSIINNLGILCVFKYFNFFSSQFQSFLSLFGLKCNLLLLDYALPIGISFYTFHGMSYVFDIYNKKQKPIKSLVNYAVFVSFFPLLVAGPIERASHLLPQIEKERKFSYMQSIHGCRLILWGFFKKVVIADNLSIIVDGIFQNYTSESAPNLILGAIAFSFQIYCDFSGYSDIALGTAKLFGIELLSNFKFPYFSRDIAEFWRRWHISLSSWFKDYLYIPLGGSKNGLYTTIRNTFIIFIVSGFWHGASWNFIIWGFIHSCIFIPILLSKRNRKDVNEVVAFNTKLPSRKEFLSMLSTFTLVTIAWVFFRSDNLTTAVDFFKKIFFNIVLHPEQFLNYPTAIVSFLYIIPLIIGDWIIRRDERVLKKQNFILYVIIGLLIWFNFGKNTSFIYFQF